MAARAAPTAERRPGRPRTATRSTPASPGWRPVLAEIAPAPPADRHRAAARGRHRRAAVGHGGRADEPSLYDGLAGDVTALRLLAPGQRAVAAAPARGADDPGRLGHHDVRTTAGRVPDRRRRWAPPAWCWRRSGSGGERAGSIARHRGARRCCGRRTDRRRAWTGGCGRVRRRGARTSRTAPPGSPARSPSPVRRSDGPDFVEAAVLGAHGTCSTSARWTDGGFVVPHTIPPSHPRGRAGHLHLVPRAGRDLPAVRGAGARRRRRGRRPRGRASCGGGASARSSTRASRNGSARASGTTTAAAAAPPASATSCSTPPRTRRTRRDGSTADGCWLPRAPWATRSSSARSGTAGGAYWRFVEHRQDPPLLPPGTSWMQGAAGIAAFLLRLARVAEDGTGRAGRRPPGPVVGRAGSAAAQPAEPGPMTPRCGSSEQLASGRRRHPRDGAGALMHLGPDVAPAAGRDGRGAGLPRRRLPGRPLRRGSTSGTRAGRRRAGRGRTTDGAVQHRLGRAVVVYDVGKATWASSRPSGSARSWTPPQQLAGAPDDVFAGPVAVGSGGGAVVFLQSDFAEIAYASMSPEGEWTKARAFPYQSTFVPDVALVRPRSGIVAVGATGYGRVRAAASSRRESTGSSRPGWTWASRWCAEPGTTRMAGCTCWSLSMLTPTARRLTPQQEPVRGDPAPPRRRPDVGSASAGAPGHGRHPRGSLGRVGPEQRRRCDHAAVAASTAPTATPASTSGTGTRSRAGRRRIASRTRRSACPSWARSPTTAPPGCPTSRRRPERPTRSTRWSPAS